MLRTDELTGYAVPAVDIELDDLVECGANDPEAGEPADWPAWTDLYRFEPGPDDLAEARALADLIELRKSEGAFTDQDLEAAGLPVG